jgi:cytochrome c oxidase assembly factor CtaG
MRPLRRVTMHALGAWLLHALALWLWHLPPLFQAALHHPLLHILQHVCFFGSALGYWWSVLGRAHRPKGSAMASLFTTMLHTSVLGALLTFAPSPWYAAPGMRAFGLSAFGGPATGRPHHVGAGRPGLPDRRARAARALAPAARTAKA